MFQDMCGNDGEQLQELMELLHKIDTVLESEEILVLPTLPDFDHCLFLTQELRRMTDRQHRSGDWIYCRCSSIKGWNFIDS